MTEEQPIDWRANSPGSIEELFGESANVAERITGVILVDVIGYSELSDHDQLVVVLAMQDAILKLLVPAFAASSGLGLDDLVAEFVPTGDGFYWITSPNVAHWAPLIGLAIRNVLTMRPIWEDPERNLGVRVSAHCGSAVPFRDIRGAHNFVGSGLCDGARLLALDHDLGKRTENERVLSEFAGDKCWVVASEASMELFDARTNQLPPERWPGSTFDGEAIEFSDKHGKAHRVVPIDSTRVVVVAPPRVS